MEEQPTITECLRTDHKIIQITIPNSWLVTVDHPKTAIWGLLTRWLIGRKL
jgi:hypothetical protein